MAIEVIGGTTERVPGPNGGQTFGLVVYGRDERGAWWARRAYRADEWHRLTPDMPAMMVGRNWCPS